MQFPQLVDPFGSIPITVFLNHISLKEEKQCVS